MSISWGKKERFKFTSAGSLTSWDPPAMPGIYAVTYRQNEDRPTSHTVVFFGQSDDLSQEPQQMDRQVLDAWKESGHDVRQLNVFVHAMPGSTSGQRFQVQEQLVSEYRPQCNR